MSISESDFNHYYYQSLCGDKANVSAAWMGEQDIFFPRRRTSVSPREEKRESEIFLRLFLFDLFQTLIYRRNESVFGFMELSHEKPFTLISDNVQIAARQQ